MPRGARLYLGAGRHGPAWAGPEQAVLVLGPPRSGKTSALIVPTVLAAGGAVVSTSTKPDVLAATAAARGAVGPCWLFDPSGTVRPPPGVELVRWSPVQGCDVWDSARLRAHAMVTVTRSGAGHSDLAQHWSERAEALLAPLLHAAAIGDQDLTTVLSWIDRRQPVPALRLLDEGGATVAGDLLAGITATETREQSAIWSTASGVLAAYRSDAARATTVAPDFDAARFCESAGALYICATGRHQELAAPLVVELLSEVKNAAYKAQALAAMTGDSLPTPVVLALDELSNIAPIPDLPALVSEGGGQGVLTMACLQDLSQARVRWGPAADGFLSLFGTTVVLPGIGDLRTLEGLSTLAGDEEVPTVSVSRPVPVPGRGFPAELAAALVRRLLSSATSRRTLDPPQRPTITTSWRRQPRLPVEAIARGHPGTAVVVDEGKTFRWVELTPWYAHELWSTMARAPEVERRFGGPELGR